jgi:hypothetical protein
MQSRAKETRTHTYIYIYIHTNSHDQQGCISYVATGTAVFIGAPVFDVSGIWAVFAIGEYYGVSCECSASSGFV